MNPVVKPMRFMLVLPDRVSSRFNPGPAAKSRRRYKRQLPAWIADAALTVTK